MTKRHIEAFLAKGCLSLLAASLAFMAVELLARKLINPQSPIERRFPVQHYRQPRPYVMFSGKHSVHELNNMGYRGAAPPSHKEPGEYRIFFLGGSTVVNGSPPISDLVQHLFTRHDMPQVKIYNFGVVSSVSSMEIVKIVMEIADLSPDMIIMYNGGNDILHPYSYDPRPGYPFNFAMYEKNVLLNAPSDYPALPLLAFESSILRRLFHDAFLNEFINLDATRRDAGYLSARWKQEVL